VGGLFTASKYRQNGKKHREKYRKPVQLQGEGKEKQKERKCLGDQRVNRWSYKEILKGPSLPPGTGENHGNEREKDAPTTGD